MKSKFIISIIVVAVVISFLTFQIFSIQTSKNDLLTSNELTKTKLDIPSLFNIYGFDEHYEMKDGKKIWYNPIFELNPENDAIYQELYYSSQDGAVVIYPSFTASAYGEPGFYTFFRGECDEKCLTVKILPEYSLDYVASGNAYQVLKLLGYPIISDVDVDKNPDILKKYDKVILLHNEYVTKKEFEAIVNHPKVIYLYPNALYAEIITDYQNNSISLIRGHNFPELDILNGFNWKFDNSILEYDMDCKEIGFDLIDNGWMLNCYPENAIHNNKVLLKTIKDF